MNYNSDFITLLICVNVYINIIRESKASVYSILILNNVKCLWKGGTWGCTFRTAFRQTALYSELDLSGTESIPCPSLSFVCFCEMFCSALLQAVCKEAVKAGPPVGLFLDAVVFGGEDFRLYCSL